MALFSRTKKTEETQTTEIQAVKGPARESLNLGGDYAFVLRSPRITEKASMAMEANVYVFDVAPDANKKQIMSAVQSVYKVKPQKVHILTTKPKTTRNMRTGKKGQKPGFKKAYVYLKKGETITVA